MREILRTQGNLRMTDHEFGKMGGLGDDISKGVFRAVLRRHRGGHPGVSGIGRDKRH